MLVWAGLAFPDAATPPRRDVAVRVEGNRIVELGSYADLRTRFPAAEVVGGAGLILLPAMINAHDHGRAIGSVALGVADDLLEVWLPALSIQPALDPYLAAAYEGVRLLQSGVSVIAHSHIPRDWRRMDDEAGATLRGYRDAGIRVAFQPPMIDQHPLVYGDEGRFLAGLPPNARALAQRFMQPPPLSNDEYVGLCDTLFATYHDAEQHRVHVQVNPAGGQWCSDALITRSVAWARQHGTRVQMHMLETYYQMRYAHRRWGKTFIQHLEAIGALGPWLTLAHMVWIDLDDLPLLAERGVGIVHNPSSNLRLRSGIAPLAEMMRSGVELGVGLDGHGLDDDQDYLRELRLAWTLSNRPGAEAPSVAARDVWRIGTQGGAAITLGEQAPLGRLAPGFLADLVLLDVQAAIYDQQLEGEALRSMVLRFAARQHV
ncbi:MAG: amidohydrolase family protein, partial [Chloroflexales bacterium]|nr:amidohydrolase family protein [Chloroflexales bacterium]